MFAQYSVELVLDEEELPYKLQTDHCSSCRGYDNRGHKVRFSESWIEISSNAKKPLLGKGLWEDVTQGANLRRRKCFIISYNKEADIFEGNGKALTSIANQEEFAFSYMVKTLENLFKDLFTLSD